MMDFIITAGLILAEGVAVGAMLLACVALYLLETQSVREEA